MPLGTKSYGVSKRPDVYRPVPGRFDTPYDFVPRGIVEIGHRDGEAVVGEFDADLSSDAPCISRYVCGVSRDLHTVTSASAQ